MNSEQRQTKAIKNIYDLVLKKLLLMWNQRHENPNHNKYLSILYGNSHKKIHQFL